ncbi:MAG: hypothetical protein JW940_38455 [Polyangiaceae bacterium]|nr:hypothetical protein [Polyangiaceae bacterium]
MTTPANQTPDAQVVLYRLFGGAASLEVCVGRETVWLTQRQMADVFDKDPDSIGLHIRNVYKERDSKRSGTTEESSVVQVEAGRAVRRSVRGCNLINRRNA